MQTLIIIAVVLFTAYIANAIAIFGIPRSISDTYYLYNQRKDGCGWAFTAFMITEAILMLYPMVELGTGQWWQFLGFLCPAGLAFCGSAPMFHDRFVARVHASGAITGVATGLAWCYLCDKITALAMTGAFITIAIVGGVVTDTENECKTFWAEIAGFGTIAGCLLYILLS